MHDVVVIVRYGHGAVGLTGWGLFWVVVVAVAMGR